MISVQSEDFDVAAEYAALRDSGAGTGAIATFTGLVRDSGDLQGVTGLYLEHYPGMTEQVIQGLIDDASKRWDVRKARVIHRVGRCATRLSLSACAALTAGTRSQPASSSWTP